MGLNTRCKIGDMARVARNTNGQVCTGQLGSVIYCETPGASPYGPGWRVKPRLCPTCGGRVNGFLDADLDPIRPPAPDKAVDTSTPADQVSA